MLLTWHKGKRSDLLIESTRARFLKRVFDAGLSGIALIVLTPLFLIVSLIIKITSPGPVLFSQERLGHLGCPFQLIKFRTMVTDADDMKDRLRHLNEVDGPVFKMRNDPRVTPIGRFLRKTSLDELPQLLNVFLGQMSLVGPRPLPTKEALQCVGWQHKRMLVKPGLTCIWQVSGRNKVSFEEWMEMDVDYVKKWSLWLDLKIILRTIPEVLRMHGM